MSDSYGAAGYITDEINQQILELLRKDGRMSYTDIASVVNVSRVAVQNRVSTMLETGVIEQFTVVINPVKVGMGVSAFLQVQIDPSHVETIAQTLADNSFISSLYHMTGPSTLHMHAQFASNDDLEQFLRCTLYRLPGVISVDCQLLLKRYKSRVGLKL